jgi:hypothetical protein
MPFNSTFVGYCLVCGQALTHFSDYPDWVNDGTSFTIEAGYGSGHDGYGFNAHICDRCLERAHEQNRVERWSYIADQSTVKFTGD